MRNRLKNGQFRVSRLPKGAERHRTGAQSRGLEPKSGPEAHVEAATCILMASPVAKMAIPVYYHDKSLGYIGSGCEGICYAAEPEKD